MLWPRLAVQRQADLAARADPGATAVAAVDERRPAAPADQHDRLRPALLDLLQLGARVGMQRVTQAAHVEQLDRRQRRSPSMRSGSSSRCIARPALGARRGAAGEQHGAGGLGAGARRRGARRSADRSPACRRESCCSSITIRPRSESGANTAERGPTQTRASPVAQAAPLVVALADAELGVHHRDLVAEALLEARRRLRRQRDLRHHHDRRASLGERLGDGPQVDLGLARAGDAVEQQRIVPSRSRSAPITGVSASRWCGGQLHRLAGCGGARPPRSIAATSRRRSRSSERDQLARRQPLDRAVIAARPAAPARPPAAARRPAPPAARADGRSGARAIRRRAPPSRGRSAPRSAGGESSRAWVPARRAGARAAAPATARVPASSSRRRRPRARA